MGPTQRVPCVTIRACALIIIAVHTALMCLGLRRTVVLLGRISARWTLPNMHGRSPHRLATPAHIARQVADVAAFFPGRIVCLDQSLVLWFLLRRRHLVPNLRIGIRTLPFGAHAWVDLAGFPINEDPERVRLLQILWTQA